MTSVIPTAIIAMAFMLPAGSALASNADGGASATTLWRCTDASGHVGYSQQACHDGVTRSGQAMQFKDERTRTQQRESMDHQLRDLKLARQMRAERLHQERVARLDKAISLSGKGKPHVIKSTPNDHRPVPISDSTRPVKVKAPKAKPGADALTGAQLGASSR